MDRSGKHVAILGLGYQVPDAIRGNDDPVFDQLRAHQPAGSDIFHGLKYRRILRHPSDLIGLMVTAAKTAAEQAKVPLDQVDMLLGSLSVGQYYSPNDLAAVHRDLGLSRHCRVIGLNNDDSNYIDGLRLANDLVQCGTIRHALVACGNNWSHHVDYTEAVAHAASDGGGAALIGWTDDVSRFRLVDWDSDTQTQYFGDLRMAQRPSPHEGLFTTPLMKLDDERGPATVRAFGYHAPGPMVNRMLARNGLTGQDITLVPHQTSKAVYDIWNEAIKPAHYIETIEELGDMVDSSVPVNLAKCYDEIKTDYLVLQAIGMEMSTTALLYKRG
ncbi:hypothetical protein [Aquabacterium sp.]|uniref:hypothetical protein n=1 Tax=Aquabacterium sp. TaxID=1872578 RepID=UPI003D6D542F